MKKILSAGAGVLALVTAAVALLPGDATPSQAARSDIQAVRFVVEAVAPTAWMTVRVTEVNASPDSLSLTRSTPHMTVRPWSYELIMHDDMYVAVTPRLFENFGDSTITGKGVCYVEVDGVEVPGSRRNIPGPGPSDQQCTYQIIA